MKRSNKLKNILRVLDMHERESVRELHVSRRQLDTREQQIELLNDYIQEYTGRQRQLNIESLDVATLKNYQVFIKQVINAKNIEHAGLAEARQTHEKRQSLWQSLARRNKAVEGLIENIMRQEQKKLGLREQKETDNRGTWPARGKTD